MKRKPSMRGSVMARRVLVIERLEKLEKKRLTSNK